MKNIAIRCRPILQRHLIDIVGDRVERQETRVKRIAAKEIIKLDPILYYPKDNYELTMAEVRIAELNYRLANPETHFYAELKNEPEPYSTEGMFFHALVQVVRVEDDMFAWSWHPEQLRALGLAFNFSEVIAWPITREYVTIQDSDGTSRRFYRFS